MVGTEYAEESRRAAFYQQLWERIRRLPGVESVGGASILPLSGSIAWGSITIEGYTAASGQSSIQADQRVASVGYFETMKIPLISGRFFNEQDRKDSMMVAIIDDCSQRPNRCDHRYAKCDQGNFFAGRIHKRHDQSGNWFSSFGFLVLVF